MPVKLKDFTSKFGNLFDKKKYITVVLILGICGIAILTFSDVFSLPQKNKSSSTESLTLDQYVENLEKKTKKIISDVEGAGKCKIMITANASSKKEFATDEAITQDSQRRDQEATVKNDVEKEIVMVEDQNGNKTALVKSVFEPEIRGVLVLCEGADDKNVVENVTNAVKILLGVSANKISVLKMK